jgi:methylmalonyl-CoA mutase cobalamin-binding subunit
MCRLHQLVCECEAIGYRSENKQRSKQSILLTCAPGENHTFGVAMVADFFRRYGWQASNLCGLENRCLFSKLASTQFTAVGFSLHNDTNYEALKTLVKEVRLKSINENLMILVGGIIFCATPSKLTILVQICLQVMVSRLFSMQSVSVNKTGLRCSASSPSTRYFRIQRGPPSAR